MTSATGSGPRFLCICQFDRRQTTFGTDYYRILGTSPHTFAMSVTQWVSPRFHATFDLFTRSKYDLPLFGANGRLFEFDAPTRANFVLGYELPFRGTHALELYTKVQNLFDERPYEDGFIGPDRWAVAGVRVRF